MIIKAEPQLIARDAGHVYGFMSDFRNFSVLLPDRISDFESDGEQCQFMIEGIGQIAMAFKEKRKPEFLLASSLPGASLVFSFITNINPVQENKCSVSLTMNVELSAFIAMLAKSPLQYLADHMADKLKQHLESDTIIQNQA